MLLSEGLSLVTCYLAIVAGLIRRKYLVSIKDSVFVEPGCHRSLTILLYGNEKSRMLRALSKVDLLFFVIIMAKDKKISIFAGSWRRFVEKMSVCEYFHKIAKKENRSI